MHVHPVGADTPGVKTYARLIWLVGIAACCVVGALLKIGDRLPQDIGYYVVSATFVAGLAFGYRGTALPIAGSVAFGIAALIKVGDAGDVPGEERSLVIFGFLIYWPVILGGIALVGALARGGVRASYRWVEAR